MLIISLCGGFVNHLPFLRLFRQLFSAAVLPALLGDPDVRAFPLYAEQRKTCIFRDSAARLKKQKAELSPCLCLRNKGEYKKMEEYKKAI